MKPATMEISPLRIIQIGTALLLIGALTGCATAGATLGSGVADTHFGEPPYVAGARPLQGAAIAALPISYQRGATMPASFDLRTEDGTAVAGLLAEMNAWFGTVGVTVVGGAAPRGTPPDVRFGCERTPGDDCEGADLRRPHLLAVGRPSASWTAWADSVAGQAAADYILVITLEAGNYLPHQRNLRGSKEVLLGTGHRQDVRWLTALDAPASVLQLTGALVARDGRARRIAAEGLMVRSTHVVLSGFGAQALITDRDVDALRTARREDLAGAPLVWQVALANLVSTLTGLNAAAHQPVAAPTGRQQAW